MAKRKIVWSHRAKIRLFEILEFYSERNKSKTYSANLYNTLDKAVKLLLKHPELGIKTTEGTTRGLIVGVHVVYYEVTADKIIIHTIWDSRQDPDNRVIK
jgi:toxin YoeB